MLPADERVQGHRVEPGTAACTLGRRQQHRKKIIIVSLSMVLFASSLSPSPLVGLLGKVSKAVLSVLRKLWIPDKKEKINISNLFFIFIQGYRSKM